MALICSRISFSIFRLCTWHVQTYFPRFSSVTVTSRSEWCCLVCLWGGCSQLQGLGDSWTHGNRRRRPTETRNSLMDGVQRPGGENKHGDGRGLKEERAWERIGHLQVLKTRYTHRLCRTFSRLRLSHPLDQAWTHTRTQKIVSHRYVMS